MNNLEMIEESEVNKLASEMEAHGVRDAKGVSAYIKSRDLTKSFPKITRRLTMVKHGETKFICDGGINPRHYGKLCEILGFVRRGSEYRIEKVSANNSKAGWDEYSTVMASQQETRRKP